MKTIWNEGWSFLLTDVGQGLEETLKREEDFRSVDIPHDWLIYDSQRLYESGTGWYLKKFNWKIQNGKRVFLIFDGIYMDSIVYVNGLKAFEWKYGYSSFHFEITDFLKQGGNTVLISACFQSPNSRWYSGAGIYRDVWIKVTGNACIEENGIYLSTRKHQNDFILQIEADVNRRSTVSSSTASLINGLKDTDSRMQMEHSLFLSGREVMVKLLSKKDCVWEYLVENPLLWDVETPVLYTLKSCLILDGEISQREENRFGFRYTDFSPEKGFFLNGRRLRLNGVCEHHDLGALGAAFNRSAMKRKFILLKAMGVNAVRGAHNMMAPGFVELADEMGILMISEAFDMWEKSKNPYDYARFFKEWHEKDIKNWICRDRNHPSVIMWSIGNEIYDTHADERGALITEKLKALSEKYDSCKNARVTIGSNYMPWENAGKCADIVKLAGYNYSEKYYQKHHEEHPDWVIYGSETSSIVQSRGVYHFPLKAGILSEDDEQCSSLGNSITSWGARSLEQCIAVDRDTPFSMGQFLWTGFDYIGEPTPYHTKNSYFGQLDTAGFPKDSYYVWQAAWTDYHKFPMVHLFPYWDFNKGQIIDVRICSNAPFTELFLNGKSLGKQALSHGEGSGYKLMADYQVPYEEGRITAAAYDEEGKEIARCERCSFGNSEVIVLKPENTIVHADGREILFVEIGTVDCNGNPVENACDRVFAEVTGAGRLVGLDNGDSTDYDSYKGKSRRLFNGRLLAMIQADKEPGKINIEVTGKNLIPANLTAEAVSYPGTGIASSEKNKDLPVVTGRKDEIPVRKISLSAPGGQRFSPDQKELGVQACIEPEQADDRSLLFQAVNDNGVSSNLVTLKQEGDQVSMTALGDGSFLLRCLSKSGTSGTRLISQLEFAIEGMGQAYLNPYGFISGSSYTSVKGEAGSGNERGVATARDGETVITYGNIDFGPIGSDEITVPVFALDGSEYPVQIWEGIPEEAGSVQLADAVYQKPSVWNVYQPETWRLNRMVKGIASISFLLHQKIHIKGFYFTRYEKAWMELSAAEADAVYGDSFCLLKDRVEKIGNNVSLEFKEMNFGEREADKLMIWGRAANGNNTIHVRIYDGEKELKQIVEFKKSRDYEQQTFSLMPVKGSVTVTFVFMPGSCFDFRSFRFM